mmetsp:Transcript_9691/g.14749  ORF Transcript_9691/g.14749 Transcript_9691/m.14749 type:complete len:90 (+) Transcript_9691:274-543(+)
MLSSHNVLTSDSLNRLTSDIKGHPEQLGQTSHPGQKDFLSYLSTEKSAKKKTAEKGTSLAQTSISESKEPKEEGEDIDPSQTLTKEELA